MAETKHPLTLVIRAVDRATGPLRHVTERLAKLNAPAKAFSKQMGELHKELGTPKLLAGFQGIAGALGGVNQALGEMRNRALGVGLAGVGAGALFVREFVGTADTFERLGLSLEAIEGDAAKAKAAMGFLEKMTVKTPFGLEDLAKTFRLMRGFGMDPASGSLQAIADQVAKLGGTGEDLTGIALQLGQAFSKEKLQAAEVRILAERGVPVWAMLARGVERVSKGTRKISTKELQEMSEKGLLTTQAINLLIEQMGLESKGASAKMASTWSGMMSNLADQWVFFKRRVMGSGAFDWLKGKAQGLLDTIAEMAENGDLQRLADLWGKRLVDGFKALDRELPKVWENLKGVGRAISTVADLFGGWSNLIMGGLAAYIGGPLVVALVSLAGAFVSLGVSIAATPLGWVAAAFVAIAAAAGLVGASFASLTSEERQAAWKVVADAVGELRVELDALSVALGGSGDGFAETGRIISAVFTVAVRNLVDQLSAAVKLMRWLTSAGKWMRDNGWAGLGGPLRAVVSAMPAGTSGTTERWAEARPAMGAAAAAPAPAQPAQARVQVDFSNMPKGTRVTPDRWNTAEVDLALGWSMVTP